MSLRIIKQGILDTVQDAGRYGFQHWGINPGGASDNITYTIANMLVGNELNEASIELHYPASTILFEKDALIALSGADLNAQINGHIVPLNTPVAVCRNSIMEFTKPGNGYCCYLSIKGGIHAQEWLGSYSTNTGACVGGYKGRKFLTYDSIQLKKEIVLSTFLNGRAFSPLGWIAGFPGLSPKEAIIRICRGNEYEQLTEASKNFLTQTPFSVSNELNRMGCRLSGIPLQREIESNLISSAVTAGTVQLLPSGQLIILMADHQTTGGYPRIAHVASADMHLVAQLKPGEHIHFACIDITEAENILLQQHQYLLQLQIACNLRLEEFLTARAIN